jgi:hypothetical protein
MQKKNAAGRSACGIILREDYWQAVKFKVAAVTEPAATTANGCKLLSWVVLTLGGVQFAVPPEPTTNPRPSTV